MCRLVAYAGPPVFLDAVLIEPKGSLVAQSLAAREARTIVNGDGCGTGWYGERPEPGLYRGILPAWSDANLASLCRQIRSGLFLAHVRAATSGEVSTANCHPFTLGRHLFMHNGQIEGYETLRREVDGLIADPFYRHRKGTSDSEAIFLAAMAAGADRNPVAAYAGALSAIARIAPAATLRFAAVHTDGERLYAFRWSSDRQPPSLYLRKRGQGLIVASEPCGDNASEWSAVPPQSVAIADRRGAVRVVPFGIGVGEAVAA
ncbi:class II glutamine amidotransferase [Aurantimonas sp. Leaf443]|uniref:class II glutamine amidotransferase n=1 Tax=Aurantimonas sp. Leaf443 TaxID=1736378 RepID=UPI0007019EA9|nr:class II glutamine amidotransferase [Aurantimonas sp. Leaf443]KQT85558.1 glutamine amidotransferase [Aurantimonas sp. Leaf443]